MTHPQRFTIAALAAAVIAAACGSKPQQAPTPQPNPDSAAAAQRRADSIAAAQADSARRAQALADSIARARAADSLAAVQKTTDAVKSALADMIHFDFDKSNIRSGDAQILDQKIAILQKNPALRIQIAGNCDERGSQEYNLALGQRRANSAKQYLVAHGIDASRIETVSYGEERPLDPAHNEAAWSQNRRDEFNIVAGGDVLVQP